MRVLKYLFLTFIVVVEAVAGVDYHGWTSDMYYVHFTNTFSAPSRSSSTREQNNIRTTMSSIAPNDCFYDTTSTYGGKQNLTRSKHTCLRWDSPSIPVNERFQDTDFPVDGSVQEANNYCRDPNNSGDLWCYTTNPIAKTDKCLIGKCKPTGLTTFLAEFEDDAWWCRSPTKDCMGDEQLVCYGIYTSYTTTFTDEECLMYLCCYKRGCIDVPSSEYAGRWSQSVYYFDCLRWDNITIISLYPSSFPDKSIADANNYCRDPENKGLPYCFVYEDTRNYCGIPTCSELASRHNYSHDCYTSTSADRNGLAWNAKENELCLQDPDRIVIDSDELRDKYPGCKECSCCQIQTCYMDASQMYNGTWSRTKSGRECKNWAELEEFFYSNLYGNTPMNSENYCRDFWGLGYTFCYTKDLSVGWEECNLRIECPDNSPKSTFSWYNPKRSTLFYNGSQGTQGQTNPRLRQTTATRESSEITTQKSQPSTKSSFDCNTSESRVEPNEIECTPSKAHAKPATITFLFSLMFILHLF